MKNIILKKVVENINGQKYFGKLYEKNLQPKTKVA